LWICGPDNFAWRAKSGPVDPMGYYLLRLGNINAVNRARFIRQQGPWYFSIFTTKFLFMFKIWFNYGRESR